MGHHSLSTLNVTNRVKTKGGAFTRFILCLLLLNIVKSFGSGYNVKINPYKRKLLVFDKSYTSNLNVTCNVSSV